MPDEQVWKERIAVVLMAVGASVATLVVMHKPIVSWSLIWLAFVYLIIGAISANYSEQASSQIRPIPAAAIGILLCLVIVLVAFS